MKLLIVVHLIIICLFFAAIATAYNTNDAIALDQNKNELKGGHEKMTEWSYEMIGSPFTVNLEAIKTGTHNEDDGNNPLRHFYNPATGKGLPGFQTAKDRADDWYMKAVKTYRNRGSTAFYELGHALHLLQDMAAPSHANAAPHLWHSVIAKKGYEWWITRNWENKIKPYLRRLQSDRWLDPIKAGDMGGYMETMATQTHFGDFLYDSETVSLFSNESTDTIIRTVVSDSDSEAESMFLVPAAIKMGSGLIGTFCRQVGCDSPIMLPSQTSPGGGHPDDNFDVSSRLIELEELDVTRQAWKDLYGRTGIKKGYNGLFLEKLATEAYTHLAASTTEEEYNTAARQFSLALENTRKSATHTFEESYYASADIAVLSSGYVDNAAELLLKKLKEPIREVKDSFVPSTLITSQPVLVIPSGALGMFVGSAHFKASLNEYVKLGGTLVVFAQANGYDYASLPTPENIPITAFGWEEDQNCFADAVTIETWHQMLSGQSRATPTVNVDGYFTGYPPTATVLLKRTANGQPALIMYEHGKGRVIASTMYSDWAYGHGQASADEIALVHDMLAWAKNPAALPEFRAGEQVNMTTSIRNITATDAAQVKVLILNPDRSQVISSEYYLEPVAAGQTVALGVFSVTDEFWKPGIYHADYQLLDNQGNSIQPQAESDSGRFAISNPPQIKASVPGIRLSITSPSQLVFFNEPFLYTFHIFNDTDRSRSLTLKSWLPHTDRRHEWTVTTLPHSETQISGSDLFVDARWMFETLRAYLYEENGSEIANYMLSFKGMYPAVQVTTTLDKPLFSRGETVISTVNLKNDQSAATTVHLDVRVTDPTNGLIYSTMQEVQLAPNSSGSRIISFPLTAASQGGVYVISSEVHDASAKKIGGDSASFELPLSRIAISPTLPSVFTPGINAISFTLNNAGKIPVNNGALEIALTDPDGITVFTTSHPFALLVGQDLNIGIPLTIPQLKFGKYILNYRQNDETRMGKITSIKLENRHTINTAFKRSAYRARGEVALVANISNDGTFDSGIATVTVSMPDAGFIETHTITLTKSQTVTLSHAITLPAAIKAGQHLVQIALTLPGGAVQVSEFPFTVPESSLSVQAELSSLSAGSGANITINNNGGVDTDAQCELVLADAAGVPIFQKSLVETVPAGGNLTIPFIVPSGATTGAGIFVISYRDLLGGMTRNARFPVKIEGVSAQMSVKTDHPGFLGTDNITAVTQITNGTFPIDNGMLHLQITTAGGSQTRKSWTSQSDFQQSIRSGIDTFEVPDAITLVAYSDNFNDGILDTDRWGVSLAPNAIPATELNGALQLYYPWSIGGWLGTTAYTLTPVTGDFDASVDYSIISPWQSSSNNHPAGMLIALSNWNARIDLWGSSPTYGSIDSYNTYANWGGAALKGKFRIKRVGSSYYMYFWNGSSWTNIITYTSRPVGPATFQLLNFGPTGNSNVQYDNFLVSTQTYPSSGKLNLKYDAGRSEVWNALDFTGETPSGTSISFRTRTADSEAGLNSAVWSLPITTTGTPISSPKGRWIEVEASLATSDTSKTPRLFDVSVTQGRNPGDIVWKTDIPVHLSGNSVENLNTPSGVIATPGKYYLQGILASSTGQIIARTESPFYVASGSIMVSMAPDKRIYRAGETVTIAGEITNNSTIELQKLNVTLNMTSKTSQNALLDETATIPAGETRPFSVTTTAGVSGIYTLNASIMQNAVQLATLSDTFEISEPMISALVTAPVMVGDDPFTVYLELKNSGISDAVVTVTSSITPIAESITIPAGQSVLRSYPQQISASTSYLFAIGGDHIQTLLTQVTYGISANMTLSSQEIYPEGRVSIPVSIGNTGLLDGNFALDLALDRDTTEVSRQTRNYSVSRGGTVIDQLDFNLMAGNYTVTAKGSLISLSASTGFQVRKTNQITFALETGSQTSQEIQPIRMNLTNIGCNQVDGVLRLLLISASGTRHVSIEQNVSLPTALSPLPQIFQFDLNLATIPPGDYTLRAELSGNDNQLIAEKLQLHTVHGAIFTLIQVPPYQTFQAGTNGVFTFKVKNTGNREGNFTLAFKAGDLADSSRSEWLKPGEEQELSFSIILPTDLDEKDYSARYHLTGNGITIAEDVIRYRMTGLDLVVTAALDRQLYRPGDNVTIHLQIDSLAGMPEQNLFARIHYNNFDEKRNFTLAGSTTLAFTVPLAEITGEKLFYGIYHQSGRSLHLNTVYVNSANDQLAIKTDKQVYAPGEIVTISISGTTGGELVLTEPGGFTETIAFDGYMSRTFSVPLDLTSGSYAITAAVTPVIGEKVTAVRLIDVTGLKVTIREARLNKAVFNAIDSIRLTLTAESNRDLPVTVRSWVVDPGGVYTNAGENAVNLSATAPIVAQHDAVIAAGSMGIHKMVYGIYRDNILIASGSRAFDVGEALVTAISTDKRDYETLDDPVLIKADLFGAASGDISFMLDGIAFDTRSIELDGFTSINVKLPANSVSPGRHTLKAVLTTGGLPSSQDTEFIFGSSLPDMALRVTAQQANGPEAVLSATVTNLGGSKAGASRIAFYDGNPASGGQLIATVPIAELASHASAHVDFTWKTLGLAGEHAIHALADYENTILEFDERNNSALTRVIVPEQLFSITTPKNYYAAHEEIAITAAIINLTSATTYPDTHTELTLVDSLGTKTVIADNVVQVPPATATDFLSTWNTSDNPPGSYQLAGRLHTGSTTLATHVLNFTLQPTPILTGGFSTDKADVVSGTSITIYPSVTNSGNVPVGNSTLLIEIIGSSSGETLQSKSLPLESLTVKQQHSTPTRIDSLEVPTGEYLLRVSAVAGELRFTFGEKPLKVLPQLEITHGFDLSPHVLILTGGGYDGSTLASSCNGDGELKGSDGLCHHTTENTLRSVFETAGISTLITITADDFKREMRTGLFNTYILAGNAPLTGQLDRELAERVFSGSGLILFRYDKLNDSKMRDLTGVTNKGILKEATRSLNVLESPIAHAGTRSIDGTLLHLQITSVSASIVGTISDKGAQYPAIILNSYGLGKTVDFTSDSLSNLLPETVSYVAPNRFEAIPGAPIGISIGLKNLGPVADVRITETIPLPSVIYSQPSVPFVKNSLTWLATLASNKVHRFAYTVELPENGGIHEATTEVALAKAGVYKIFAQLPHPIGTEPSLDDIRANIVNGLSGLSHDKKIVDSLLKKCMIVFSMPCQTAGQTDHIIEKLLGIADDLDTIGSDANQIRFDVVRLLKVYGRKWFNLM